MSPVTKWQKMAAGAFVSLAVGVWLFMSISLSGVQSGQEYYTLLDQRVRGLAPSSLVCYNGIPIGQVTKIGNNFELGLVRVDFVVTTPDLSLFGESLAVDDGNTLFSLPTKHVQTLEAGRFSQELRRHFDRHGYPIAENLAIQALEPGRRWVLKRERKSEYGVLLAEDSLVVYSPRPGTQAELVTSFVTGLQYIDLEGGRSGYPTLPPKSPIPARKSAIDKLQKRFDEIVEHIDELLEDNLDHLQGIVVNIRRITENANEEFFGNSPESTINRVHSLLEKADTLMGESNQRSVHQILSNLKELSDPQKIGIQQLVANVEQDTHKLLESAKKLTDNVNRMVKSEKRRDDLTTLVRRVNRLVVENEDNIGDIAANLRELFVAANHEFKRLAKEGNSALATFRHFLQKELYQTNMELKAALQEISAVMRILKAKPNALLWGAGVGNK